MSKKSLDSVVTELLPNLEISEFSLDWIANSPRATDESIKKVYNKLKEYGLSDDKIASRAQLLGRDPETIDRNYKALQSLGLSDDKIASQAQLLEMNPETIDRNYKALQSLGLSDDKIASQAQLLGINPETIKKNYISAVSLLRKNYENRSSGRDLIMKYPQLLGNSSDTINANVQYLHSIGIDYNNALLLETTIQLKRKKMAWMLRELFDYETLTEIDKKSAIKDLHDFIKSNPALLVKSINALEKSKEKLRLKGSKA